MVYANTLWKKIDNQGEKITRISKYSKTFSKKFVTNNKLGDVLFMRFRAKKHLLVQPQDFLNHLAISERIVRINNYLCTTFLPEIVDVYYRESNGNLKIYIIKEYIKGVEGTVNLVECVNSGILTERYSKKKHHDDNGFYVDPTNRNSGKYVRFRRVIEGILTQVVEFEKFLYSKGLVHVGLHPSHILLGIDNITKFAGERYILRHINGFIDDPSAIDEQKYGSIIIPRYTPELMIKHINDKGKTPVKALSIVSYQVGVLLFDILTSGKYFQAEFKPELIYSSSLNVPYKFENKLKNIIEQLTNDEYVEEINDFDDILEILYSAIE